MYLMWGVAGALFGATLILRLDSVSNFLLALMGTRQIMSVPFLSMYLGAVGWLHVLVAIPTVLSGWGIRRYDEWARMMGMMVAIVQILSFPFGTILGSYGIWVLLSPETEYLFLEPPVTAVRKSPTP